MAALCPTALSFQKLSPKTSPLPRIATTSSSWMTSRLPVTMKHNESIDSPVWYSKSPGALCDIVKCIASARRQPSDANLPSGCICNRHVLALWLQITLIDWILIKKKKKSFDLSWVDVIFDSFWAFDGYFFSSYDVYCYSSKISYSSSALKRVIIIIKKAVIQFCSLDCHFSQCKYQYIVVNKTKCIHKKKKNNISLHS